MAKSEQYGLKKQLLDEVQHEIMWQKLNSINALLNIFFSHLETWDLETTTDFELNMINAIFSTYTVI